MLSIQLDDVSLTFGDRCIFSGVNLAISPKSRIALIGINGSGKSTLMKIATGLLECDGGRIISSKDIQISYLPQFGILHEEHSLLEEVEHSFRHLAVMEKEAENIAIELANSPDNQNALLHRYQDILDTLHRVEWDRRESRMEQVLLGLGFRHEDFDSNVSTFSGGWQMRIALAKILLESPDILLLDEPTNYLDIDAREWLRDFIKKYSGGIMLVSHDRAFLDATCTHVAEIWQGRLNLFQGTFSAYEIIRQKKATALMERWKHQQEEIARIELFINRFRYKDSKATQVQSRIKMLEKMERIEIPSALKRLHLRFPKPPHCGKWVLQGNNLERRYGDMVVFSGLNLEVPRGSRTVVTGINGAGKTTLLRIVAGRDENYSGQLSFGDGVKTGYFSPDMEAFHDVSLTVLEEISRNSNRGNGELRTLLGGFLFSGDDIHKRIEVLSGGERSRLVLLKTMLQPINFLVLDEPTNHLDITSKDILLDALIHFEGTLLLVSHDRYFLDRIAERVLEIRNGIGRLFLGDYNYYRDCIERESLSNRKESVVNSSIPKQKSPPLTGPSYEEQKKHRSKISQLKRQEHRLAIQLEEKEQLLARLQQQIAIPENYSNPDQARKLAIQLRELENSVDGLYKEWEKSALALEEAEN